MSLGIGFAGQVPSLPTGAGVTGLGETFTPDLANGTGTYVVPLDIPNGPNDCAPRLSLRYCTADPNGPFGRGWSLPLPRLLRSATHGARDRQEGGTIVLEGSGPLVRQPDGSYRPEVDTGDWRIEQLVEGFCVTDRSGKRYRLGTDAASRITSPAGTIVSWLLAEIEDNLGYTVRFGWRQADTQRYLERIEYGPYRVLLHYQERADILRDGRHGFLLETRERCRAIELHLGGEALPLVRRWELGYDASGPDADPPSSELSLLTRVTLTGFDRDGVGLSAPPLTLGYREPDAVRLHRIGVDVDGLTLPGLGDGRVELVDWHGDGLPDILEVGRGGSARVWPNRMGRFGPPRTVDTEAPLAAPSSGVALLDLTGDGVADLVSVGEPLSGYRPRTETGFGRPVSWRRAPRVALTSPHVRVADVDGDGLPEVIWSAGKSLVLALRDDTGDWQDPPVVIGVGGAPGSPPADLGDPHVFCADMTGDGTADLVRVDGGGVIYWPYLHGNGFGAPVRVGAPPRLPPDVDPRRLHVVDVDGDGCADVVLVDEGRVRWWPNRAGATFGPMREVGNLPTSAMTDLRLADLTGAGSPALCWSAVLPSGRAAWFALELVGGVRPYLLTSVDNGLGARTTIRHTTSAREAARDRAAGSPWPSRHPVTLPVVSEVTVTDAATGRTEVTRYRYHDGRYDGVLREVCGFARVEQEDVGGDGVATLLTTRWFAVGLEHDGSEPLTGVRRRSRRAVRGRLLRQERAGEEGRPLDAVDHEWEVLQDGASLQPRLVRSTTWSHEGAVDPVSWVATQWRGYDDDGNVTEVVETAHEAGLTEPVQTLRTLTTYATDPTGRYRQRIARIRQEDGTGRLVADTLNEYDGLPYDPQSSQVGAQGLITARWGLALTDELATAVYADDPGDLGALGYQRRDWGPGWWVRLGAYARSVDVDGTLRGVITGPRGSTTRITLDAVQCHPERIVDDVGNTITASVDARTGRPLRQTDPAGGEAHTVVDPLARVVSTSSSGDGSAGPDAHYEYRTSRIPVEVVTRQEVGAGLEARVERRILDGDGHVIERRVQDEAGEVCEETTVFGPRGLPVRRHLPTRPAGPGWQPPSADAPHTAVEYDPLGRVVRTTRPDGAAATIRHLPGRIEVADEADTDPHSPHHGTTTVRHLDATGRVVRVDEQLGDRTVSSHYAYDVKGQLSRHTDVAGNVTTFVHDLLGRTLRVQRPEATHVAVLDAAGNTVEARTGTRRVFQEIDPVDRVVAVRHDDPAAGPVTTYTYGAGGSALAGRLVRVAHEGGTLDLDYDSRGRITRRSTQFADGTLQAVELTYRRDDLLDTVSYPAAGPTPPFVAHYRYDRRGRLRAIDGIIDAIDRDLAGRAVRTVYANGVAHEQEYDGSTGWLRTSRVSQGAGTLREVSLGYDAVGNVTTQSSPDPALRWTYRHDDLYRLVGADGGGLPDPLTYEYDTAGNLIATSDLGTFSYGEAGAAATCLTRAGADVLTYDDRGHLVQAPWGRHTVDAQGRLRSVLHADGGRTDLTYDHEGRLVRRRATSVDGVVEDVLSLDPLTRHENGELVVLVSDGTRTVAQVHADGHRSWLHTDHLGSLVLVTDDGGAVVRALRYGPYGEVLDSHGPAVTPQGYATGQTVLAGLVLLGARWYSPRYGRFVSPDPVVGDALDPLAWNPYAYAHDNPVSYVDPTGRSSEKLALGIAAAVVVIAVLVVVTALTFGAGGFAATAVIAGSVKVSWGGIFAGTVVGVLAGGTVGALSSQGGDFGDILVGALVGAAIGGLTAFGAAFATPLVSGFSAQYLYVPKLLGKMVAGSLAGSVQNAGIGLATAISAGLTDPDVNPWDKVLTYAGYGAVGGAVAKFGATVLQKVGPSPTWLTSAHAQSPTTTADVAWMIGYKSATKALDKTVLSIAGGKLPGQSEVGLELLRMAATNRDLPGTWPPWP